MNTLPVSLYDAFTDVAFGGSQAAVVTGARDLCPAVRQRIAKELGLPATAFVDEIRGNHAHRAVTAHR